MRLLAALIALCTYAPVCGAGGCSSLKHLENGRTFFRYGGLLVIFSCRPGYKLHGHRTNSCVSGHWSRHPAVCVGSGCSSPGPLTHGVSSMTDDGSWAAFSCNRGFRLYGPSMLYCKGHTWNGTKPVCKESDMMSSGSSGHALKANAHLNRQAAVVQETHQQSHSDTHTLTASREANLKIALSSRAPPQTSSGDNRTKDPITDPPQRRQSPESEITAEVQVTNLSSQLQEVKVTSSAPETGTRRPSLEEKVASLVASLETTSTPQPFSTAHTWATTAVENSPPTEAGIFAHMSPTHKAKSAPPVSIGGKVLRFGEPMTSQDLVAPSSSPKMADEGAKAGVTNPSLSQSGSVGTGEPEEILPSMSSSLDYPPSITSSSTSSPPLAASSSALPPMFTAFTPSRFTGPNSEAPLPDVGVHSHTSTPSERQPHWSESHNITTNTSVKPTLLSPIGPVCPYPLIPEHGTFYFQNVENPGPREYSRFVQYSCHAGFTLAHGDVLSYCQQGGTWSGVAPVCLDVDECVMGRHECQQRCINTFGSYKCGCDDGYQLSRGQTSCTDVDECLQPAVVAGCVFSCVNTPGSFYCQCPAGYSVQTADNLCQDVDECAGNHGRGSCMEQCHNSPGSYRCSCPHGHVLAGDGHSCITECPPGYRKQPAAPPPQNSTSRALREECVDIDECQEDECEWQCVNLPGSHHCICPKGYSLHTDGRRCRDVNECSRKNGGCSHLCVNQRGGHKCACPATHRLSSYSWKKCLPRAAVNATG